MLPSESIITPANGGHLTRTFPLTVGLMARWCGARSACPPPVAATVVNRVWNDSRLVGPGDVFVALRTETDDGHRYVAGALERGAAAAIVDAKAADLPADRLLFVKDPVAALQQCANAYRQKLGLLVIALTGSSGKTTTRSFITAVLERGKTVGSTYTNWNNHIGVPLSILRFGGSEDVAVLEMGANHPGEISPLSRCAAPDIALINNIGYAHVGLFGSLANTTKTKFEILDGLKRKTGLLLINGDDPRLVAGAKRRAVKTVSYGFSGRCDFKAGIVEEDDRGTRFLAGDAEYRLPMRGRHYVYAALPAIFLGLRCGISESDIRTALAALKPAEMRGATVVKNGVSFIVDCYNANPSSMDVALEMLAASVPAPKRVAVVGDMRELGRYSTRLHARLGRNLKSAGMRAAIAVGQYAPVVAKAAIKAGMPSASVVVVQDAAEAADALRSLARPGDTVLLKASRLVKLETVLDTF